MLNRHNEMLPAANGEPEIETCFHQFEKNHCLRSNAIEKED